MLLQDLPLDIVYHILAYLDIQDVLRLRILSSSFLAVTYSRPVWAALYARSALPRPPGPLPTQSAQALEDILRKSARVQKGMFGPNSLSDNTPQYPPAGSVSRKGRSESGRPSRVRRIDTGAEEEFALLGGGRWLISERAGAILCRDLDRDLSAHDGAGLGASSASMDLDRPEHEVESKVLYAPPHGSTITSLSCVETYASDGRWIAFIVCAEYPLGGKQGTVNIFSVQREENRDDSTSISSGNPTLKRLLTLHVPSPVHVIDACAGSLVLVVSWTREDGRVLLVDIKDPSRWCFIRPKHDAEEASTHDTDPEFIWRQSLISSRTHILLVRTYRRIRDRMHINARISALAIDYIPFSSCPEVDGDMEVSLPWMSCILQDTFWNATLLQDAGKQSSTGDYASLMLAGLWEKSSSEPKRDGQDIVIAKLSIPLFPHLSKRKLDSQSIRCTLQHVTNLPQSQLFLNSASITGSVRAVYASEKGNNLNVGALSLSYADDDRIDNVTVANSPNLKLFCRDLSPPESAVACWDGVRGRMCWTYCIERSNWAFWRSRGWVVVVDFD
ncbi:hypothetical protein CONPUDRAFT_144564 [Coniophora puteana RWD-64-598 SS2]|uniref:F-box domain-containing protein n=1 Tax=Coniophora puteana (strain RWD-64-598) TaxID=741705 RepID=A0A5M3MN71_CONPW|nr:uncharacterized protein CONPUDRAFT_144564 [Coniophora puteana RWD-64-598 SS2]EIW80497.1 hypothetical protein CONPUDRAFT_144564 [Coniophora puteana RWD-64-598 SS2]